ncbi:D-Ala-D-Ala carboxypeptidase family metallohydrolase [Actinopolymorpha sp. B17G11]|uniref:D-Ala-D-Ala carboxypeptidase family metallohydrolase n=1 Tax=unclassified Actinopolymorpha TaxID=2627063 RepID=UPI0032D96EB8
MARRRLMGILAGLTMVLATAVVVGVPATTAHADGCYTWNRTLQQGMSGSDVTQLQIRVAGWPGFQNQIALDGAYGPQTAAAVQRFQAAYGLAADGVAGPATFAKIYELQDNDCTPIHFSYAELNQCNSTWAGGRVSATTARANALRTMWKLEALRHALGDNPLIVTSGFRSEACNSAVGGASNSRHLYGDAADLVSGSASLCRIVQQARSHGFGGLFGPGYPGHNDHIHADGRSGFVWDAPTCGV